MTNPEVAILMLCLFIVLVLLGFPIAFTLLAMGVAFGYYAYYSGADSISALFDNQIFYLLNQNTYSVMENDTLVAIPLFLFMGYVVERANIVDRLFFSLYMAARNLPGSLAIAALLTCAVFSTASGIVGAVVTLMGLLAYPAMANANYDKSFASGVICAGGTLGILIPPSIMLIVYAAIAELSPLRLYAAAVFPGILLAGMYIMYVMIRVKLNPSIAPKPKLEDVPPASKIYMDLLINFIPLTVLITASSRLHSRRSGHARGGSCHGGTWRARAGCDLSGSDMAKDQGERVPDRQGNRHGLLAIRWLVDVCFCILLPRRSRHHRPLVPTIRSGSVAVPDTCSADHFPARLAARMVRNSNHLRADIPAAARNLRRQSILLCYVGGAEPADILPHATDGHVGLLFERRAQKTDRACRDIQRLAALSWHCDAVHGVDVCLPGIALWFPDYLFGEYIK